MTALPWSKVYRDALYRPAPRSYSAAAEANAVKDLIMHYLTRGFMFSASHRLHNPALSAEENADAFGMCENVHGHNYRLRRGARRT